MDWQFKFGLGLTIVSLLLPYAVKEMPPYIAWAGIASGMLILSWGLIPNHDKVPILPAIIFASCVFGLISSFGYAYKSYDSNLQKTPIQVMARINPWDYQNDTKIAGIKWQSGFSDVRILVANATSEDFTNVDILIQPETGIAKAAVISAFARCDIAPAINAPYPVALMIGKDGKVLASHPEESEAETIIPIYRAHCEKLPPNTQIEIVIATAIPMDVDAVGSIFNPHRRDPKWVDVKATYKVSAETRTDSHHFDLSKRG